MTKFESFFNSLDTISRAYKIVENQWSSENACRRPLSSSGTLLFDQSPIDRPISLTFNTCLFWCRINVIAYSRSRNVKHTIYPNVSRAEWLCEHWEGNSIFLSTIHASHVYISVFGPCFEANYSFFSLLLSYPEKLACQKTIPLIFFTFHSRLALFALIWGEFRKNARILTKINHVSDISFTVCTSKQAIFKFNRYNFF